MGNSFGTGREEIKGAHSVLVSSLLPALEFVKEEADDIEDKTRSVSSPELPVANEEVSSTASLLY